MVKLQMLSWRAGCAFRDKKARKLYSIDILIKPHNTRFHAVFLTSIPRQTQLY